MTGVVHLSSARSSKLTMICRWYKNARARNGVLVSAEGSTFT